MENHRAKLDPTVFSIADLKREAIKKLDKQDKSWAGKNKDSSLPVHTIKRLTRRETVYYNEGAMDLLTYDSIITRP